MTNYATVTYCTHKLYYCDILHTQTMTSNKMKNEKYHTVPTIPNINIKVVERCKFDIRTTQINNTAFSLLGTVTV
jgi:hypothetical protein